MSHGYKILLFLAKNPIVHDIAKEFGIPLDLAYEIQGKHMSLWQSMIKVKTIPEKPKPHHIDLGYRAIDLFIPREFDSYARRSLFALDSGHWHRAWYDAWDGICHDIYLKNAEAIRKAYRAAEEAVRVKKEWNEGALWKSGYPLINGKKQRLPLINRAGCFTRNAICK